MKWLSAPHPEETVVQAAVMPAWMQIAIGIACAVGMAVMFLRSTGVGLTLFGDGSDGGDGDCGD